MKKICAVVPSRAPGVINCTVVSSVWSSIIYHLHDSHWLVQFVVCVSKILYDSSLGTEGEFFFVVLILPYLAIFMIHTTFLSLLGLICLNSLPCCCCFSVAKSCPNLCDPMNSSTPDFPVLHYIPEFGKTHVHQVSDAIQPYNPLSLPSLLAFSLSQHQGLFQWVSSHQMAKYWSFSFSTILPMYIQGWFPLGLTGLISL